MSIRTVVGRIVSGFAISTLLLAAACTEEQIVVASQDGSKREKGADGKDTPPTDGGECTTENDCEDPANAICERVTCGEATGKCVTRPAVCNDVPAPACGCDGITYWNDCLRRAFGVSASTQGECAPGAFPCQSAPDLGEGGGPPNPKEPPPKGLACPVGASCAHLLPPDGVCDSRNLDGACWRLPARCPRDATADGWVSCASPQEKGGCVSTCDAIRSEGRYLRAIACP